MFLCNLTPYGLCEISEDKPNGVDIVSGTMKSCGVGGENGKIITDVTWLNMLGEPNSNSWFLPKGTVVMLVKENISGTTYWEYVRNNITNKAVIRKQVFKTYYPNADNIIDINDDNSYTIEVDTEYKKIALNTNDNDGEKCGISFTLNGRDGVVSVDRDGHPLFKYDLVNSKEISELKEISYDRTIKISAGEIINLCDVRGEDIIQLLMDRLASAETRIGILEGRMTTAESRIKALEDHCEACEAEIAAAAAAAASAAAAAADSANALASFIAANSD